jgi:nucleoside-diphosphate-sugar epimerase
MSLPILVMTGATGFLGRHLLAGLHERYQIFALSRRAPQEARAPVHPNITWRQVDIADGEPLAETFARVRQAGEVEAVLHFAAHYDFTGDDHPEYQRTNIDGLRNVLELCKDLKPKRFVFSSSVAACDFPKPGSVLTERSAPDGTHIYAKTKRVGEAMLREYREHFPVVAVRLGALFSDWCEYAPLFMFLGTWLSSSWKARVLGGKGRSAVPYLHVRDGVSFFSRLLQRHQTLENGETLIASTDRAISHRELFEAASQAFYGFTHQPILMPRPLSRFGLVAMDLLGRILGERPFERPWMGSMIDKEMHVDASYTRARLGWAPNPRLGIVRRMPFMVENLKTDPIEWSRRNLAAMKTTKISTHLRIFQLLEKHEQELVEASLSYCRSAEARERLSHYQALSPEDLEWAARQTYLALKNAVRTKEKGLFRAYCRDIAERRLRQGFKCSEVVEIIRIKNDICLRVLLDDPHTAGLEDALYDHIDMTFRLGVDEVYDAFEELSGEASGAEADPAA